MSRATGQDQWNVSVCDVCADAAHSGRRFLECSEHTGRRLLGGFRFSGCPSKGTELFVTGRWPTA